MLNPNFPLLAAGKEQSLESPPFLPPMIYASGMPRGISFCWAIIQRRNASMWPWPPAWQAPPLSGEMAGHVCMARFWLVSPNTCDLWNLPWLSHWAIPSHFSVQSGTWQALPNRMLVREGGVLEPDCGSSQVLNMTLMESKGQHNPDQDLHTILVWMEKGTYAQWGKHSSCKITV